MSFKKILLLFLAFASVGTYYYFIEIKETEKAEKIKQEEKRVFSPIKKEEIYEILIENGENKQITRLVKKNNTWEIKDPVKADVDKEAVELWLDTIADLTMERIVSNSSGNIAKFGLEKPAFSCKIKTHDKTLTLQIGDENPTGNLFYGKLEKNDQIFLIASYNKADINKTVYQLRDKNIFHFENNDVQGITVTSPKGNYSIEKKGKAWQLISPKKVPADTDQIFALLQKLKTSEIKKFIAEKANDLNPYGLQDPDSKITLLIGKDNAPHTLVLGKENKKENAIYAKNASKDKVFLLDKEFLEEFPYRLNDIRDKSVLPFQKEKVLKIEFIYPDKTITITRNEENWAIVGPKKAKADAFEINALLNEIENSKVKEFIPIKMGQKETFALDNPRLTVKVIEKDAGGPKFVSFGSDNQHKDAVYATTGSKDEVLLVEKELLSKLSITEISIRYKYLLDVDEERIAGIQILTGEKEYELTRRKDKWSLNKPEKKKLDTLNAKNILWDLGSIKFKSIIDESEQPDLTLFGLDKPFIKVNLLDEKGKNLESLFISSKTKNDELLYATTAKSNTVFSIEKKFRDDLLKDLEKL